MSMYNHYTKETSLGGDVVCQLGLIILPVNHWCDYANCLSCSKIDFFKTKRSQEEQDTKIYIQRHTVEDQSPWLSHINFMKF